MPDAAMTIRWDDASYSRALSALTAVGDPDLVLQKLGKGRHDLRVLESDDEIAAALETRREAVINTTWVLDGDGPVADRISAWLKMELGAVLRGAWSAAPYGFSVLRAAWPRGRRGKLTEHPEYGIIAPVWIGEWPIEHFVVTADGVLRYRRMDNGVLEQADPPEFFMTRRNATWRNPYGEALLSRLYWPWFFRYNGWRFWMQFIERFGDPILTGRVMTPEQFVEVAQKNGFAAVLAVGPDEAVDAVTPSGSAEHQRLVNELDRRIQKVILGQTLTTDVGRSGSYAAAKVHDAVRRDKRLADLNLLGATVQRIIDWLWRLNGGAGAAPRFSFDIGFDLTQEKAAAIKTMRDAGWRATPKLLARLIGDVDETDFEPEPAVGGQQRREGLVNLTLAAANGKFTEAQTGVEDLIAETTDRAPSPIPPSTIRDAIERASGPEELDAILARLAADYDPAAYRELLERALFAADVYGYAMAARRKV